MHSWTGIAGTCTTLSSRVGSELEKLLVNDVRSQDEHRQHSV